MTSRKRVKPGILLLAFIPGEITSHYGYQKYPDPLEYLNNNSLPPYKMG